MTTTFAATERGYANIWARAKIRPERVETARAVARRISASRTRYAGAALGKMPWYWVGITHDLEAGGNFTRHLHNGDPLTRRTTHVPAGRPLAGSPPFTWEESARDALAMKNLGAIEDWSVPRCLYEHERYNGFGYVGKVNSPYVWSFTDQYDHGKYVADGKYDATAVSQQCGAAATMRALVDLNLIVVQASTPTPAQQRTLDIDLPIPPVVTSPVRQGVPAPQWDVVGMLIKLIRRIFA
jgi:lysozyme family protein